MNRITFYPDHITYEIPTVVWDIDEQNYSPSQGWFTSDKKYHYSPTDDEEEDLNEIEIVRPNQFIKLNLPKDLDREVDPESDFDDIIFELIALNPQIPEDVFTAYDTSGLGDDVIDDLEENVSLQ